MSKNGKRWLGLGLGALLGYVLTQQGWAIYQLATKDAQRTIKTHTNRAPQGLTFSETTKAVAYTRTHIVEDGIERIVYQPRERRFETPILMQHGMWHGAWCWELWQALFAEWGLGDARPQLAGPRRFAGTAAHRALHARLLPRLPQGREEQKRNARAHILGSFEDEGKLVVPDQTARSTLIEDQGGDALDSVIAALATARALRSPDGLIPPEGEIYAIEGYVYA